MFRHGGFQRLARADKLGGDFELDDLCPGNRVWQQLHCLKRRVDLLPVKRIKASE